MVRSLEWNSGSLACASGLYLRSIVIWQRQTQRALLCINFRAVAETSQTLSRLLCQHPSYLTAFSFDSGNCHVVISRGLVTHPSDHCRLSSFFNRDPLGACYRAAAHWRRVGRYRRCQTLGDLRVAVSEIKELEDCAAKVLNVLVLLFVPSPGGRGLPFGVGWRRSFGFQFSPYRFDLLGGCPNAKRISSTTLFLFDRPTGTARFYSACHSSIARRQEFPLWRNLQYRTLGSSNFSLARSWADNPCLCWHF